MFHDKQLYQISNSDCPLPAFVGIISFFGKGQSHKITITCKISIVVIPKKLYSLSVRSHRPGRFDYHKKRHYFATLVMKKLLST